MSPLLISVCTVVGIVVVVALLITCLIKGCWKVTGNMMTNITQIVEGFKGSTGIDPMSVISGMLGSKLTNQDK